MAYDFFGSQYVQRYTSQLVMYVLYTEIGHDDHQGEHGDDGEVGEDRVWGCEGFLF